MDAFDFVIIGAGTAGCGLAYRLGERGYSVCVLEAGPKDTNPLIRLPAGIMKTSHDPRITWRYEIEGSENTKNRKIPTFYGKTLGGSSAVNGMCYNRGQVSDFDNWSKAGNEGWDYNSVLPYFRKSERYISGGEDQFRGRFGPLTIQSLQSKDPISDRFVQGAVENGIPINPDYNGRIQMGVSYAQTVIHKGRRWSSAHAYLHPARRRFNVDVRTQCLVRRVLIENGAATGVEYSAGANQETQTVRSRINTIICAGATFSPKLLQLSGIGPSKLLRDFNIPVLNHLPGVGENLHDHYSVRMVARAYPGFGTINERARGLPLMMEALKWLLGKPSALSMTAMSVFTFCKSDPKSPDTDYSLMFIPACLKGGRTRELEDFPGVSGGAWQQRPESRGHVRIRSRDINEPPIIWPNYLDSELDRRIQIIAMKHLKAIFISEAMRPIVKEIILPEKDCRTDDEWLDYIRGNGMTSYHPAGTCKMGPSSDPMAVVDPRLRVHGVKRLRVVDASVLPTQISGQLNASVMMIAEKAADLIAEDVTAQ